MLINGLYKITKQSEDLRCDESQTGAKSIFDIELNPSHPIFDGHFPSEPVLPGVVSIQIIKECCERIRGCRVVFSKIGQCKFPSAVNPVKNRMIKIEITLSDDNLRAEGSSDSGIFIKLKAKIR